MENMLLKEIATLLRWWLWTLLLGVGLGLLGLLHPLFDSLSHFRIHFLVLIVVVSLLLLLVEQRRYRIVFLMVAVTISGYLWWQLRPFEKRSGSGVEKTINFAQFNLSFRNRSVDGFDQFLTKNSIDVVTLQEVTQKHRKSLERFKALYPHQTYCHFATVGGVAILSKYPFVTPPICIHNDGLVVATIDYQSNHLSIASVHLYWPYPFGQDSQINRLSDTLSHIPSPKIIAGDFNAAPWSHAVQKIADLSDTSPIEGIRWTLNFREFAPLPQLQLPIDHILLSGELRAEDIQVAPTQGSDHLPVVSRIGFVGQKQD